jgi:hypothetical protein
MQARPERPTLAVQVECYAGHRGEETPRRFRLGDEWLEVAEIVDRWLAPDHRYFKARTADGDTYVLRHDAATGAWELTMFDRGHARAPRTTGPDTPREPGKRQR